MGAYNQEFYYLGSDSLLSVFPSMCLARDQSSLEYQDEEIQNEWMMGGSILS